MVVPTEKMSEVAATPAPVDPRQQALKQYQKKLLEHREIEAKVKECRLLVRGQLRRAASKTRSCPLKRSITFVIIERDI